MKTDHSRRRKLRTSAGCSFLIELEVSCDDKQDLVGENISEISWATSSTELVCSCRHEFHHELKYDEYFHSTEAGLLSLCLPAIMIPPHLAAISSDNKQSVFMSSNVPTTQTQKLIACRRLFILRRCNETLVILSDKPDYCWRNRFDLLRTRTHVSASAARCARLALACHSSDTFHH